jgi:hypothetical protein
MKSPAATKRGYLSALAEPVRPGEPVLAARRGEPAFARSGEAVVPPEIHDELTWGRTQTPPQEAARASTRNFPQHPSAGLAGHMGYVDRNPAAGDARSVQQQSTRERHQDDEASQRNPLSAHANDRAADEGGPPAYPVRPGTATLRQDAIGIAAQRLGERRSLATGASGGSVSNLEPAPGIAARDETRSRSNAQEISMQVSKQMKARVQSGQPWDASRENNAAPVAAAPRDVPEARRPPGFTDGRIHEAGDARAARVHIGTVEVRVTAAAAPAQPQGVDPSPAAGGHEARARRGARTSAAGTQTLARGLAWRYGLVQG